MFLAEAVSDRGRRQMDRKTKVGSTLLALVDKKASCTTALELRVRI
jgi:hypothetical protein